MRKVILAAFLGIVLLSACGRPYATGFSPTANQPGGPFLDGWDASNVPQLVTFCTFNFGASQATCQCFAPRLAQTIPYDSYFGPAGTDQATYQQSLGILAACQQSNP